MRTCQCGTCQALTLVRASEARAPLLRHMSCCHEVLSRGRESPQTLKGKAQMDPWCSRVCGSQEPAVEGKPRMLRCAELGTGFISPLTHAAQLLLQTGHLPTDLSLTLSLQLSTRLAPLAWEDYQNFALLWRHPLLLGRCIVF
jgi:hypothetical protein